MKQPLSLCAAAAILMLTGCAGYDHGYGSHEYGQVAVAQQPSAYYDNFYGPYWDGYWGPDGAFWFSEGPGRPFRSDVDGHFRREAADGFRPAVAGRSFQPVVVGGAPSGSARHRG
jgi:hypothetical protein